MDEWSSCEIDQFVGDRIEHRRMSIGMTQQRLAKHVGITCRQLSEYERGLSRPSARRILAIARVLNVTADLLSCRYEMGNRGVQLH
jgi:transcriptional regulator with XRE-family HTH domain